MQAPHRVVIVGGGFAGLNAALALRRAPVAITLIDRRNFHLFQPLLYQVASGALSPANIASPLRVILRNQPNARVLLGEVEDIDAAGRRVLMHGAEVPYDTLMLAAGASHSYFGNDHWQALAPGLKTVEDATEMRQRLLSAFEAAERATTPAEVQKLLTFVIVGGGPTGVELAGALGEITRDTLRGNFRHINPADAHILLVESNPRVLPQYAPELSAAAGRSLTELGVQVRLGARVVDVRPDGVRLRQDGVEEDIASGTIIWAAGVKASPLGARLAAATGATLDRAGRVHVDPCLHPPGHPEIFVAGDLAHVEAGERPLAGVAPVAMQAGSYVGREIVAKLQGRPARPFAYVDLGSMATIGRGRAVADIRGFRFSGLWAWLAWLFVHVLKLVGFHNKLLVCVEWSWCYLTRNRSARLITGPLPRGRLPLAEDPPLPEPVARENAPTVR